MSQPSANSTTKEIVASIKIGIGVSLPEPWAFCFEDVPELHNFFSPAQLLTIEMHLGRIEDIEMQVYPEDQESNNQSVFPGRPAKPENPSWYSSEITKSIHRRIGKYVRIGFRSHPGLKMWFELGSAIGRHINTLNEETRANLESEYRKIFESHADPSIHLEVVFNELEQYSFLKEKRTQAISQIRDFARALESEDPGRATEQRILTTARKEFSDLTKEDILVIRAILSLSETGQKKQFTGPEILTELIKGQYEGVPDNWEFEEDEKTPNSKFKSRLVSMVDRGIIFSRQYRLGFWSGLPQ